MKEDEIEERSLVEARGHLSSNQTDSHLAHLRSSREALDRLDSTITGPTNLEATADTSGELLVCPAL